MNSLRKQIPLTVASFLASAVTSFGLIIAEDDINYPDTTTLIGESGGSGFTNNWNVFGSPGYTVTSGVAEGAGTAVRDFNPNGSVVYWSTTLAMTGETDDLYTVASALNVNSATNLAAINIVNNRFQVALFSTTSMTWSTMLAPTPTYTYTQGNLVQVVAKLTFNVSGDETLDLWVNPTSDVEANNPIAATVSLETNQTNVSRYRYQTFNLDSGTASLADVRIGTDFATVSAVPEPSTLAFLSVGLTAMVVFRRRRLA